jgi:uncharacterized protein (DUF1778 family)
MRPATHVLSGKIQRIEARVQAEQKDRIEYAASLSGTSVFNFIVRNADVAAVQIITSTSAA